MMGRKKRKPVSAATKSVPSSTESKPDPVSDWEAAKNRGNLLYGQSQYEKAVEQYISAIILLDLDTSEEGLYSMTAVVFQLAVSN